MASDPSRRGGLSRAAQVIIVSSVMFTFISYWRTAAVVLCDLASTAYYIGGIVEQADRPGGAVVHPGRHALQLRRALRLHRELLAVRPRRRLPRRQGGDGRLPGQALRLRPDVRLHPDRPDQRRLGRAVHHGPGARSRSSYFNPTIRRSTCDTADDRSRAGARSSSPAPITLYFFRQNLLGIHESSDKALKIMIATTVMAVVMLGLVRRHAGRQAARPIDRRWHAERRADVARPRAAPELERNSDHRAKPGRSRSGSSARDQAPPTRPDLAPTLHSRATGSASIGVHRHR